jgi:hypothetical protein
MGGHGHREVGGHRSERTLSEAQIWRAGQQRELEGSTEPLVPVPYEWATVLPKRPDKGAFHQLALLEQKPKALGPGAMAPKPQTLV